MKYNLLLLLSLIIGSFMPIKANTNTEKELNRLDEYVLVSDTPSESSYVDEGEGIIDQEPVRIIKNPAFSFDDSSSMANQSREDVRRAAIRSVLDSLNR